MNSSQIFFFQFLDHSIIGEHVEYTISILNPENGQTVFLKSRYSSLLRLHRELENLQPQHNFPAFPPKRCCGNLNETFISQRKRLLERYFNELFVEKIFFEEKVVKEFLFKNQIHYEVALTKLDDTPNTGNDTSELNMKLTLTHSRSIGGLNLSLQRNASYGVSIRRSSSVKLDDIKKSPIFQTPSSQTKLQNPSSHDDFKLTEEMFPLDYFEWLNGILELQGFLLENDLIFTINEEKWMEKLKVKGLLEESLPGEEIYLGMCTEKGSYYEILKYETYKEDGCKILGNPVNQICLSKFLGEYKEIFKFQKGYYKEHFEKKTGRVKCLLILAKERLNGKQLHKFTLESLIEKNRKIEEKKVVFVFHQILMIIEILIKNNVLIKEISLQDFGFESETQELKLINLENCEYIKEGLSDIEKVGVLKKVCMILIKFKFQINQNDMDGLEKAKKDLSECECKENDAFSTKILKKMLETEILKVSEIFNEFFTKSKTKRKRSLEFDPHEISLKKDRLKLAKLCFLMKNYSKAIKHLKKHGREVLENVDFSKLSKEEVQEMVKLKLFILKTLKKSDCTALFYEDYLYKTLKLQREHIQVRDEYFYLIIKKIAKFYISIQDHRKAIDVIDLQIFKENLDPPCIFQVDFNELLSICYRELDNPKMAFYFIDKSIELLDSEPSFAAVNVKKADLIKEKALVFISIEKNEQIIEGIKLLNKALSVYKENYENSEIDLANTKELIGNCCMKINEFGLAVQALEEAWAIKKSISFTVPQSFERLLLNLAKCHYGLKDLNKAQSFLSQTIALIKEKKTYTEDLKPADEKKLMHIEAELRALKANICLDSDKLDSSRNNFRKALKLYKKAAGKSNIILGELYEAYGKVNIRIKDIEKGKKCLLRSLTIYRLNLGESDMKTLEVAENIADLDFQLGEYEDCLLSYQELIDIYRDKHPEKQEEISDFLIRLGFINFKTSQYPEALENFKEAGVILLEMDRKTVGNPEKSAKIRGKFARIQKDIVRIEELL